MMRPVLHRRLGGLGALAVALGASCGDPTQLPPDQVNFDRPVDIAFACYGNMRVTEDGPQKGETIETAQPTVSCESRTARLTADMVVVPPGQEDVTSPAWYAFVLQSATGTVAVTTWSTSQPSESFPGAGIGVLDTDPLTPGRNAISVGEDPVAIATDKSGCYELTANAGSCDLSVLDINSALDGNVDTPVRVDRIPVVIKDPSAINDKTIGSKPIAMVAGFAARRKLRPEDRSVGNICPIGTGGEMQPSGVVYIAYPSCHMVAAVNTSSGKQGVVVGAIQFDAAGVATVLTGDALYNDLSCPDECAGDSLTPGTRPVALALRFDDGDGSPVPTTRLAIGAENSNLVTVVDLDNDSLLPRAAAPVSQVKLETPPNTKLGVMSLAMSPVIGMGGYGKIDDANGLGGHGQYVYAVATDNTVRVVDVLKSTECDTEIDGRFLRAEKDISRLSCFPVGDPGNPPRRVGVKGPGIELTGLPGDPVPTSVAIVQGRPDAPPPKETPALATVLYGYFAIITASTAQVFVANVDDDGAPDTFDPSSPQSTAPVLVMAHQLRDSFSQRNAGANSSETTPDTVNACVSNDTAVALTGGPRITTQPARNVPVGTIDPENSAEMPGLWQFPCQAIITPKEGPRITRTAVNAVSELQFGSPDGASDKVPVAGVNYNVRDRAYPELRSVFSESWALTWEGPLTSGGKQVDVGQMEVDSSGMRLVDDSRPFCELGAEPFDIVQFHGCNPTNLDADCPAGYTCYVHPDSKVSGIGSCMLATEAPRLSNACRDFLTTMRRYTIGRAESRTLTLLPRKHELYATPLDGCADDDLPDEKVLTSQCNQLAEYVANNNAAADRYVRQLFVADPDRPGSMKPDPAQKSFTRWECRTDEARAPISPVAAQNKRCIQTCGFHLSGDANKDDPNYDGLDRDVDCGTGTICQGAAPGKRGVCMEGVVPPPACVAGPQSFDVRASEAFSLVGSRSGYIHPLFADTDGVCKSALEVPTVDRSVLAARRLQIGRIPLKAPPCNPAADPITGEIGAGSGVFDANPCSLTVTQTANENVYNPPPAETPNACDRVAAPSNGDPRPPVMRMTTAIQFSNPAMTMHLVDPTYPGDLHCNHDRLRGFDNVAMVVPAASPTALGYQIAFDQQSGFKPLTLSLTQLAYPVKVVRGPTESIWVLDDGDYLSNVVGQPSTRGQVFRVESVATGHVDPVR